MLIQLITHTASQSWAEALHYHEARKLKVRVKVHFYNPHNIKKIKKT